ncbi:hypothetical protein BHE74_00015421 [Ensete ventricosum]|nr:hypothetical protein BHE74_00015421 [Ensete ventricosum]
MSFYSKGYGSFILEVLTVPIAYHAIVLRHTLHGPCSEAHILLPTAMAYRPCPPYLCYIDRMIANPSMPVSGQLHCVGSATLAV